MKKKLEKNQLNLGPLLHVNSCVISVIKDRVLSNHVNFVFSPQMGKDVEKGGISLIK